MSLLILERRYACYRTFWEGSKFLDLKNKLVSQDEACGADWDKCEKGPPGGQTVPREAELRCLELLRFGAFETQPCSADQAGLELADICPLLLLGLKACTQPLAFPLNEILLCVGEAVPPQGWTGFW